MGGVGALPAVRLAHPVLVRLDRARHPRADHPVLPELLVRPGLPEAVRTNCIPILGKRLRFRSRFLLGMAARIAKSIQ